MKRFVKILLGLAGGFVVLLLLAAVFLPLIYDQEDLKQAISQRVEEQTGRQLSIEGALDFSVFPWLAVEVRALELSNAKGFGEQAFARIGQARIGVALIPLFRKQIAVDEITLSELELALAVNAQGQNNWDDLVATSGTAPEQRSNKESSLFTEQRIAGLNITDARILFDDQQAGTRYRFSDFSMQTGVLADKKPMELELSGLLEDLLADTRIRVDFTATTEIDLQAEKYEFENLKLNLLAQEEGATAGKQALRLQAPRVSTDLAKQTLQIAAFSAQVADLKATGSVAAQGILSELAFNGSLLVEPFSPTRLLQSLQQEALLTSDPDALQHVRLSTVFNGSKSRLNLNEFKLELDQSMLSGEVSIADFDSPKIQFELDVDEIDIDRYLAPASGQSGQENVVLPREELKNQDVQGRLKVGKLTLGGLEFDNASITVAIRNGLLSLHPLTAGFYDGQYSGNISLDSSGSEPLLSIDENIDSITFQRLVADLVDSESFSGLARGHARLSGRGASSDEVIRNLHGELGLSLSEGALEGINIWYEIRRSMAKYKGLEEPPAEPDRTVFSRMQLDAAVAEGVMTSRELVAELPFLTVRGQGTIDLGRSVVDLALVAAIRNAPELVNDPLSADLVGRNLPFKISGTLQDPSVSVDWEALLMSEAAGLLLDKLGLGPASKPKNDSETKVDSTVDTGAVEEEQDDASKDPLKDAATETLFDLLLGTDKDQDKDQDKEEDGL